MIVNQWFVFVNAFRDATNTKSIFILYFSFYQLFKIDGVNYILFFGIYLLQQLD